MLLPHRGRQHHGMQPECHQRLEHPLKPVQVHWLDHVGVRPGHVAESYVARVGRGGKNNHRHGAQPVVLPEPLQQLPSVDPRQVQIQQHQRRQSTNGFELAADTQTTEHLDCLPRGGAAP